MVAVESLFEDQSKAEVDGRAQNRGRRVLKETIRRERMAHSRRGRSKTRSGQPPDITNYKQG